MTRRVAVTGSTGTIGGALVRQLEADGDTVIRVVRDRDAARDAGIYWSPATGEIDAAAFEGLDAVVHLAAAPIRPVPWTRGVKRKIRESRRQGTTLLASSLATLDDPPPVLVSQSAIGFYGPDRGDEILTEESEGKRDGFLADVVHLWEACTVDALAHDRIRVCLARSGVVLDGDSGMLQVLKVPFLAGVGGRLGSGAQWMSWISLEDEARALAHLVREEDLRGPVNLTAPEPTTNREFTEAMGEVLHRPTILTVPSPIIAAVLGDMGKEMALASQRVLPARLEESGFVFRHREVRPALRAAFGR